MKQHGFTLVELILVVAILGLLSVSAMPTFFDIHNEAFSAAEAGLTGAINDGLVIYRANDYVENSSDGTYPAALDEVPADSKCTEITPCFTTVLMQGYVDEQITKTSDTEYRKWTPGGDIVFKYDSVNGKFYREPN